MPFTPLSKKEDSGKGNFYKELREFFNKCGELYYRGSLVFYNHRHEHRRIPIFLDECLKDKTITYDLLKHIRKELKQAPSIMGNIIYTARFARSIHQNEDGNLPYSKDVPPIYYPAPYISYSLVTHTARLYGTLPNKQVGKGAKTYGKFLEYTFDDGMHVACRFVVDYSLAIIYMTLGHYHRDSFALLVPDSNYIQKYLTLVLPFIEAKYSED